MSLAHGNLLTVNLDLICVMFDGFCMLLACICVYFFYAGRPIACWFVAKWPDGRSEFGRGWSEPQVSQNISAGVDTDTI